MSAIWGMVSFAGAIPEQAATQMTGPYEEACKIDRYSVSSEKDLFMGCGIQYITKESEKEGLPLWTEDRMVCFNADALLDNREEFLKEFSCAENTPDGTLMFLAYKKWGAECFKRFRGLFSVAVYDREKKTLILASDKVSARCLYYYRTAEYAVFSTLMKPILAVVPDLKRNEWFDRDFLTAPGMMPNISATETPYTGVLMLPPATCLTIRAAGIEEKRYWRPSADEKKYRHFGAKAWGKHFTEVYGQCVADAIRTDGEVGISMSSGFDSASVGVLAADRLKKAGKNLYTYTYVPFEKPNVNLDRNHVMNEKKDVETIVAAHSNMIPTFTDNQGKNCITDLKTVLKTLEIPIKAFVNFPNLFEIAQLASERGCRVVLTGQCGNSTVSHGYIDDVLYDLWSKGHLFRFLLWLNRYSKTVKESRKKALIACMSYYCYSKKEYCAESFLYQPDNPFLKENVLSDYPMRERFRAGGICHFSMLPLPREEHRKWLQQDAQYTYMGVWETKLGLKNGLVFRDATKDERILAFSYAVPYRYFAYRGTPRWFIRGNMKEYLPECVTADWLRYSVQNGDYFARITRDWDEVKDFLLKELECAPERDYIDKEKMREFLQSLDGTSPEQDSLVFDSLVFVLCDLIFDAPRK